MSAAEGNEKAPEEAGEPSRDTGPRDKPGSIAPPPIPLGKIIAERYRVIRSVGGGGMGHVFEVEHEALGRRFALKVLRVTGWDDELVRRFEREAKALARIASPRVAQVSDFGFEEGIGPWFVMELVAGMNLQERLDERGAVSTAQGLELAIALCEAVEDVHAEGIVHRDLKPANIGLPPGPIPLKLLDFGLAAGIDDELLTRITKSHQVLGSLPYIAPETFAGARPSKAQDLWAMGIVIYEMFTGRLPFEAPSTAALMHKILTAPPPAFDRFPEGLREVLGALLVKNPGKRLSSAAEAAELLRAVDGSALPDSLELELPPEDETRDHSDPITPPFAVTEAVETPRTRGAAEGEAAHVLSAAIAMPEQEAEAPVEAPAESSRQGLWLGVALGTIALLIALVAYLMLREPAPDVPPVAEEPVETVPEPTTEAESAREAAVQPSMEAAVEAESAMEAAMEAGAVAPESAMEEAAEASTMRRRRRATRMTTQMSAEMTTAMESPMEAEEPTMEASSWMGEIIGGGWSGEIIEGTE